MIHISAHIRKGLLPAGCNSRPPAFASGPVAADASGLLL
jgi:hypothetical protein